MEPRELLKRYFGHSAFRPGQETLIDGLLSGRDVLGVMPTGAGKSMCYQIPALAMEGMTLVISPLISLMADQVAALNQAGVPGAYLNSALDLEAYQEVLQGIRRGIYKLLYVAPERLTAPAFLAALARTTVSLVAVDEAHCVSQWGQDFRPSYLKIPEFLEQLPARPVMGAFTATATAQVKADIIQMLGLRAPEIVTTGFDRPNLYFGVVRPRDKDAWLLEFVKEQGEKSGIVYCATRKNVESVCQLLQDRGFSATRYHAGLPDQERQENQEDFVYDRRRIMVATNAFGMGIDKSNVGYVVHYNMPKNLESYYQEAGRAGRDGEPADCILLYAPKDVQTAKFLILNAGENEETSPEERTRFQTRDLERLDQMVGYCKTTACLRQYLLGYFGEHLAEPCGNCSSCQGNFVERDITVEAQKILSGVARVERMYPYGLGVAQVIHMLRGSRNQRVLSLKLDTLPTYGILREVPREQVQAYVDCLVERGYLVVTKTEFPVVHLTVQARQVLFQGERVLASFPAPTQQAPVLPRTEAAEPVGPLMGELKALRTRLAQAEGVPAYIIFSNATLADMAVKLPTTMEGLLEVSGVGSVKAARYGAAFLDVIRDTGQSMKNTFYYYYQDLYALLEELLQEEAEKIIEAHHAFDLWQEGFLDAIAFVLEHRRAAYHVFNSNARGYVTRYFLRLGDFILTDVVRELSAGLPVSLEDRRILVDFYKHALVGVVSDWLEQGMKEDLSAVIRRIGVLLEGNIRRALENSMADE